MLKKIGAYFRREVVLSAALLAALLSFLLTPPCRAHVEGIDTGTLLMLFSLMTIVSGLRRMGVLDQLSDQLTQRIHTVRGLAMGLVSLCFGLSMLVTNDVALLTLVPLTLVLLRSSGEKTVIWTVVLETIAANLGSMVTPIGNPQNLYLYTTGRLNAADFVTLLLPYALLALALALLLCLRLPKQRLQTAEKKALQAVPREKKLLYAVLVVLALLAIAKVMASLWLAVAVLAGVVLLDRQTLHQVDYTLLATFVCFFVFVASIKACEPIRLWLEKMMSSAPMLSALLTSQVISNVPACLLLSPFTQEVQSLALGVNLGGLGTLIASLASLISFRLYGASAGAKKGRFFGTFTALNLMFLAVMLLLAVCLGQL